MTSSRKEWFGPAGLIVLSVVPMAAGAVRLGQLGAGAAVTPDNSRFFAAPLPVVVHIISASVFCVLGAVQFVPGIRRRRMGWHRVAGRLPVPCGLAAALTGLWMTLFYALPPEDGELLLAFRLVFGVAMVASLVLGFAAVRRRDIAQHRAWMMRGYAIGLGAGTQVLTNVPWLLLVGEPEGLTEALLMAAGWLINLAVAECIIRGSTRRPATSAGDIRAAVGSPAGRRPVSSVGEQAAHSPVGPRGRVLAGLASSVQRGTRRGAGAERTWTPR